MNHPIKVGSVVKEHRLISIRSEPIRIPEPPRLVHLQFRRFAGCPICDLHMHSIMERHAELVDACVCEIVVFHSTTAELLPFCGDLPFETIADPDKRLYAEFGVESGLRALVDPRVWFAIVRGVARSLGQVVRGRVPMPTMMPGGGRLGLPAEFLIAPSGRIVACKYGAHAYDQWTVDEVIALARTHQAEPTLATPVRDGD